MLSARNVEHSTSVSCARPLPRLNTASSRVVEKEYQSGASYKGAVQSNKRSGKGVFTWPNGSVYDGEFVENMRHGKGVQIWPDGSCYDGHFADDLRHGRGVHRWANNETYEGDFFRDRRHGRGVYRWPDGSSYSGSFYMDKKEGYGTFTFNDSTQFEGLYQSDEREGPGVVSYQDGSQDVGLWHREKLVKLCTAVPCAFTVKDHPDFHYDPEQSKAYIQIDEPQNQTPLLEEMTKPPSAFEYPPHVNMEDKLKSLFSEGLYFGSCALDIKSFDDAFFERSSSTESVSAVGQPDSATNSQTSLSNTTQSRPNSRKQDKSDSSEKCQPDERILAWNNTSSCIAMQKHIERHKSRQGVVSFNVDAVLKGNRKKFGPKGPIELASEAALEAAAIGEIQKLKNILNAGLVDVEVSDKSGHSLLLGAAVNWHEDVINCLLDYGADVNKLTDEGVSALAACHLHIYPVDSFKYNSAEKYLIKPTEEVQDMTSRTHEADKGVGRRSSPVQSHHDSKLPSVNPKQNHKLKEEYQTTKEATDDFEAEFSKDTKNVDASRKLGRLQINRVARVNTDHMMSHLGLSDTNNLFNKQRDIAAAGTVATLMDEFESMKSVRSLGISVSDKLIDRCATELSDNELVVSRARATPNALRTAGTVRRLALDKSQQTLMKNTVKLLLKRGADPNASCVPMPVLFFAVKAADVEAVRSLLHKGASTKATLPDEKGALTPLHIASGLPGPEGPLITQLLLHSLANPDARARQDDSYLGRLLRDEWDFDLEETPESRARSGGRTPLHIAAARDDNILNARDVVELLLEHRADPDLLCNGQSPLSLAIASGNDPAIDELLAFGADPNLPLTHGVGSALCAATSPEHEHRRSAKQRVQLIDKLIASGADVMAPVRVGPKGQVGTAVDYAHHLYNSDKKISHVPYHALTQAERETFTSRKQMLEHLSGVLRARAVQEDQVTWDDQDGKRSVTPGGATFMYTGSGAQLPGSVLQHQQKAEQQQPPPKSRTARFARAPAATATESRVTFKTDEQSSALPQSPAGQRKSALKFCYECGRSVGVKLTACSRCKAVYYCSKSCKLKGWNARHKEECIRIGGRSPSPAPGKVSRRTAHREESPTHGTDSDREGTTVISLTAKDQRVKKKLRVRSAVSTRESRTEFSFLEQTESVQKRPKTQGQAHRVPVRGRSSSARTLGSRGALQPLPLPKSVSSRSVQYSKFFSNSKISGLASIKGFRFGGTSAHLLGRNVPEPLEPSWKAQYMGQRVWLDNYSWV